MTPPKLAVVDYGIGNLRSAEKALQHVGADARLTDDRAELEAADALVLPGVGNFGRSMVALRERAMDVLVHRAVAAGVPFLGICVGMQMLYEGSDESPEEPGLGVLEGRVRLLPEGVKRPQMQWNQIRTVRPCALLDGLDEPRWFYFVHSYAADRTDAAVATCEYGSELTAAVQVGSLFGTQFHPEKSGAAGLRLLAAFVESVSSPAAAGRS